MPLPLRSVSAVAALFTTTVAADALWFEPRSLEVTHTRLELPGWHAPAGLRVALLADLHVGAPHVPLSRVPALVAATNAESPDIILLLGDYVIDGVLLGDKTSAADFLPALAELDAPLGVWAVMGNHDWWNDGDGMTDLFEAHGIQVLEDEHLRLHTDDGDFWLAALGDAMTRPYDITAAIPPDDGLPTLLMTHSPASFEQLPARATLTVAGHTHGGQILLPLIGTPARDPVTRLYLSGHIQHDARDLFVTRGIGTSVVPVRFGAPPEIAILEIHPQP